MHKVIIALLIAVPILSSCVESLTYEEKLKDVEMGNKIAEECREGGLDVEITNYKSGRSEVYCVTK